AGVDLELEGGGIDLVDLVALLDLLVIDDVEADDRAGHFRRHADKVGADIGVVGVGDVVGGDLPGHEQDQDGADDAHQAPDAAGDAAGRRRGRRRRGWWRRRFSGYRGWRDRSLGRLWRR